MKRVIGVLVALALLLTGCSARERQVDENMKGRVLEHKAATYIMEELEREALITSYKPSPGKDFDYEAQAEDGGTVYLRHYPSENPNPSLPGMSNSDSYVAGNMVLVVRNSDDPEAYEKAFFALCEGYEDHVREENEEKRAAEASEKKTEREKNESELSEAVAWDTFRAYAAGQCPNSIKLHSAAGVLENRTDGENRQVMGCEATVTNTYGASYEAVVRCTVEGTDNSPEVTDFVIEPE